MMLVSHTPLIATMTLIEGNQLNVKKEPFNDDISKHDSVKKESVGNNENYLHEDIYPIDSAWTRGDPHTLACRRRAKAARVPSIEDWCMPCLHARATCQMRATN